MKIIQPSFEILDHSGNIDPQKYIEKIARTCYKSEDRITKDSSRKFIKALYDSGHWAMLEHFIFVYKTNDRLTGILKSLRCPYINIIETSRGSYIGFSARSILEIERNLIEKRSVFIGKMSVEHRVVSSIIEHIIQTVIRDYDCYELFGRDRKADKKGRMDVGKADVFYPLIRVGSDEIDKYCKRYMDWCSVRFIISRGVSHELVRHRPCSFAQESQRYVNYSKDKFGGEITVIEPCFFKKNTQIYENWKKIEENIEKEYLELIKNEVKPQEAREILTNSTKTEIVVTATLGEWEKIFELRCDTPAHPSMRQVMIPLFNEFDEKYPDIFTEIKEKVNFDFNYPLAKKIN